METDSWLKPLPTRGRVVRASMEGKRRGSRNDVFLVALKAMPVEELARIYLGDDVNITDEVFTSLASDVSFIQTGRHVVFAQKVIGGKEDSQPLEPFAEGGLAPSPTGRMFGFCVVGLDARGVEVECVGYVAGIRTYPSRDSSSLELRVRHLAAQAGIHVDEIYVNDTGSIEPFHGGQIISLTTKK